MGQNESTGRAEKTHDVAALGLSATSRCPITGIACGCAENGDGACVIGMETEQMCRGDSQSRDDSQIRESRGDRTDNGPDGASVPDQFPPQPPRHGARRIVGDILKEMNRCDEPDWCPGCRERQEWIDYLKALAPLRPPLRGRS